MMNDSDNPLSRDEAASTGEESRPEPSIVRSVSSWLVRAFARNGDATWQESLEELIEEEEDISEQITPEERDLLMNLLRFGRGRSGTRNKSAASGSIGCPSQITFPVLSSR